MSMGTVNDYYETALFAVVKTLMRDYASKFFQDIASYIGAYYTDDEDDDIYGSELSDAGYYLRLLKDEVNEFVERNENGLITDLFVDEFKNMCVDEDVCNDILNGSSVTQSFLDNAIRRAKESYNIDESSKRDLAFAVLLFELSFDEISDCLYAEIEDRYDIVGEIKYWL